MERAHVRSSCGAEVEEFVRLSWLIRERGTIVGEAQAGVVVVEVVEEVVTVVVVVVVVLLAVAVMEEEAEEDDVVVVVAEELPLLDISLKRVVADELFREKRGTWVFEWMMGDWRSENLKSPYYVCIYVRIYMEDDDEACDDFCTKYILFDVI